MLYPPLSCSAHSEGTLRSRPPALPFPPSAALANAHTLARRTHADTSRRTMASSARRMNEPFRMTALGLLLIATLSHGFVAAEVDGEEVVTGTTPPLEAIPFIRGDMNEPETATEEPEAETPEVQVIVFPTEIFDFLGGAGQTETRETDEAEGDLATPAAPEEDAKDRIEPQRGDGPDTRLTQAPVEVLTTQTSISESDVMCVGKEKVQDRDAVSLTLKSSSTCVETRMKIQSVLEHLCGEDCKLNVYQEDNSNQIIISGPSIDDDAKGMAEKFNNDNIKDKIDVEDAVPRWGKNSKVVLVSLLLTGLLLAALLVAGYYLKTHRGKTAKGVRLAESFQVDEENQANTLVSVAPLQPQEPLDKPTVNGESAPDDAKTPSPPTNGHSATQTPVADTEM